MEGEQKKKRTIYSCSIIFSSYLSGDKFYSFLWLTKKNVNQKLSLRKEHGGRASFLTPGLTFSFI